MSDDTPQTPDDNGALDLSGLNFGPAWARDPSESKNLKIAMISGAAEVVVMIVAVVVRVVMIEAAAAAADSVATKVVEVAEVGVMMIAVRSTRKWSLLRESTCALCPPRRVSIFSPSGWSIPGKRFLFLISQRFSCKAGIVSA